MKTAPVAIIGMHRSGTSCLAGCLEDLGLALGDVVTSAPHNLKGNRENPRFWPVHDAVLARVGASWDSPPSEPVAWTRSEIVDLKSVLEDYDGLPAPWGFKDPRATVILDGWFEVLPDLKLVASIRHPLAVAGSLAARNGFDRDKSLSIWSNYNEALLAWRSRVDVPVIDYDAPDYEIRVRAVASSLNLNASAPMPFRDGDLHHQKDGGAAPTQVEDLWRRLQAAAA